MTTQNIIPDDHQSYIRHLEAEERQLPAASSRLRQMARWRARGKIQRCALENASARRWLYTCHHQRHAGIAAQLFSLSRLGPLPCALSARAATLVSR